MTRLPDEGAPPGRLLGTTGARREREVPDVPTIAEAGVPGDEMGYWFAAYERFE